MTRKIQVLIVDDHNMIRKGLNILLNDLEDIEVVAEASDGQYALDICRQQQIDVVLMDVLMPRMDGVEATTMIMKFCPETKVIALTSVIDEESFQNMIGAGAKGYLTKDISGDELARSIRKVQMGQSILSPQAAHMLILVTTRPTSVGHDLTERENEILALLCRGLSNGEIGMELNISSSTVKNHVSNILNKLGAVSRTQAAAIAVEHKLVK